MTEREWRIDMHLLRFKCAPRPGVEYLHHHAVEFYGVEICRHCGLFLGPAFRPLKEETT